MKKSLLIFILLVIVVFGLSAQDRIPATSDLKRYADIFWGEIREYGATWDKLGIAFNNADVNARYAALGGDSRYIDTPLEATLSAYFLWNIFEPFSAAEAAVESIFPHSNPRLVDRQLGAYVYKDLIIYRFLNDTQAVSRHETMLNFITGRGNVTRAEVEAFYRNGIRDLVSETVDEEFNKVSFTMGSPVGGYNAILTHNVQNGHYKLSYEGFFNGTRQTKELSASSLEALTSVMSSNTTDFNQVTINTVRSQAALIPAVVYASWKPNNVDAMQLIKSAIVDFYLNLTQAAYDTIRGIYARYMYSIVTNQNRLAEFAEWSLKNTVRELTPGLNDKLRTDVSPSTYLRFYRIPADSRFNIFSTPYQP